MASVTRLSMLSRLMRKCPPYPARRVTRCCLCRTPQKKLYWPAVARERPQTAHLPGDRQGSLTDPLGESTFAPRIPARGQTVPELLPNRCLQLNSLFLPAAHSRVRLLTGSDRATV